MMVKESHLVHSSQSQQKMFSQTMGKNVKNEIHLCPQVASREWHNFAKEPRPDISEMWNCRVTSFVYLPAPHIRYVDSSHSWGEFH